jgi:hypothetical protein
MLTSRLSSLSIMTDGAPPPALADPRLPTPVVRTAYRQVLGVDGVPSGAVCITTSPSMRWP